MNTDNDEPMTRDERIGWNIWVAYGPFWPGSAARDLKNRNADMGFRTCWHCLAPYRSLSRVSDGNRQRIGRGNYFCSWTCYALDLAVHPHSCRSREVSSNSESARDRAEYSESAA